MILAEIHNLLLQVSDVAEDVVEVANDSKDTITAFGIKLVKWKDFLELVIRFSFNLAITLVIAKGFYYTKTKRKDFMFTFILMGVVLFLLCFSLSNIKLQLGFAFGLFAIFGIMRFRTDGLPIKEMAYLFIIIAVSVVNSIITKKISYVELIFTNFVIIAILYVLEFVWLIRHESVKKIVYDKVALVHVNKMPELIADLEQRTGLKISRVEVMKIDYLRDVAQLLIYYFEDDQPLTDSYAYARQNDEN